jgi:hypothetical protein
MTKAWLSLFRVLMKSSNPSTAPYVTIEMPYTRGFARVILRLSTIDCFVILSTRTSPA